MERKYFLVLGGCLSGVLGIILFYHFDFFMKTKEISIELEATIAQWWLDQIEYMLDYGAIKWNDICTSFEKEIGGDFLSFWYSSAIQKLYKEVILLV